MKNIPYTKALEISQAHKLLDNFEFKTENLREEKISPSECCATLVIYFLQTCSGPAACRSFLGAKISEFTFDGKRHYSVSKENENIQFDIIPLITLRALRCQTQNCYQNCINACSRLTNGTVVVSEVSPISENNCGLKGLLHSYIELDENVYDLTYGFSMERDDYIRLFNVKEVAQTAVSKIHSDIYNGTLTKVSNRNISPEVYLMSRDTCAKIVEKDK